ncbi:GNAT family N-acetyltransferase [Streptomyces xiaopingdaonensis]|uniref:GNAT family N-acetyltransferase n=1 Tax=Streptomyces xiaopingdaonensis TaxID=1565415 RepID=UPI000318FBD2|nr:GNAT family N-acetyltransferase [Streptomyces xiaopingdaonensis]
MIETERLALSPLGPEHLDAFWRLHSDARVNRHLVGVPRDREAAYRWLVEAREEWERRGHGLFAVELREGGGFLGRCGLHHWPELDEVEIGWTLHPEARGRGYATEAARAVLDWGFAHLPADRFTAMIQPANTPSIRLAERLGFTVRRSEVLLGVGVTVYAVDRPTG